MSITVRAFFAGRLAPALFALVLLAPSTLAEGHAVFHAGNPLVQRFKSIYPGRARVTCAESGEVFTIVNTGPAFEVLAGSVGEPSLGIQADAASEARLAALLADGVPADPMVRLEVAAVMACASEAEFGAAPEPAGPGPELGAKVGLYLDVRRTLDRALGFQGKAAGATSKPKKLYWGLKAKLEFEALEDWQRRLENDLLRELGRDLKKGNAEIACDGTWSAFVDTFALLEATRQAKGEVGPVLPRIKAAVVAMLLDPQRPAREGDVLVRRLAILERMQALADAPCGI